jgi:biopolymer transport protein ExbB
MFSAEHLWELLKMGWLSNVPLTIGSIMTLAIFGERVWKLRGLEKATRDIVSQVIDALVRRDLAGARGLCEASDTPAAKMLLEGLRWNNVAIEDLDRVFATVRAEMTFGLRRGLWIIGTTGSLAPFVGLFGTVIGIIRAFGDMAAHGSSGFAVVAQGISEALVATAAGLGVAIVALMLFNYLQVRVGAVSGAYARGCERLVQAMLYVESSSADSEQPAREVTDGNLVSA